MTGTAFNSANWAGYDEATWTNPSSATTDQIGYVDIADLSSSWDGNVQSDGADIRVTKEDGTELPIYLIAWAYNSGSPTGLIVFKYTGTLAASGTQKVRVWAGYSGTAVAYGVAETYGRDNVYSAPTAAYSLEDSGTQTDVTGNGNDATENGTYTDQQTALVGLGISFNSGYIDCGSGLLGGASAFTIVQNVRWDGTTRADEDTIVSDWAGSGNRALLFRWDSQTSSLEAYIDDGSQRGGAFSGTDISDGNFHVAAVRWDGSALEVLLDGTKSATSYSATGTLASTTDNNLRFGTSPHAPTQDYFRGIIDEAYVFLSSVSDAFIAELSANMLDPTTFWGTWAWTASGGGANVSVPLGTISMSGLVPTIASGKNIAVPADSISISGQVPVVATGVIVASPADAITMSGLVPTVTAGGGAGVSVPVGVISLTDFVPTIATGATVAVPLDAISMAGYAPTILTGVLVAVPLDAVTISGLVPSLTASDGITVDVPLDVITISNLRPAFAVNMEILTNHEYEVYIQVRPGHWEQTLIVFTGTDRGILQ